MIRFLTFAVLALILARMGWIAMRPQVDEPSGGPVTIELSVWGMPWENDLYTKVYIPEFEKQNPGIKVKFHHFEDYGNRVRLSFAGDIAPDVMREGNEGGAQWILRGMNLPLDEFIDGPDGIDRNDFFPVLWDFLQLDGKTYGVPQDINIVGLYYNKDLFDKAGLEYPDSSWTWTDLKRAAVELTEDKDNDGHPEVLGIDMGWGGGAFRPFLYQAGGKFWSEDRLTVAYDSPEAAEALRFYKGLMRTYTLTRSSSTRGGLGPDKFFEAGKVAMYYDGSWITPSIKKNAPKLRFGVAPLPKGNIAMSVSGSCFWGISRKTRHPKEAWKLVKYLTSTEALTEYWRYLWVAPPARWSSLRSEGFKDVVGAPGRIPGIDSPEEFREKCAWVSEVLEQGWTTLELTHPFLDKAHLYFNEAVDKVLLENADPAKALKEAAQEANRQLRIARESEELARGSRP